MKNFIIGYCLILCLFFGCKSTNKVEQISLKIENEKVYFYSPKDSTIHGDVRKYPNDSAKLASINIIKYSLYNPSNERMLFLIRDIDLFNIHSLKMIINEGKTIFPLNAPLSTVGSEGLKECNICRTEVIQQEDREERQKLKLLGAKKNIYLYKNFLSQSVILDPGETRTFKSIVSFPYVVELDPSKNQLPVFFELDGKKSYDFSVEYKLNRKELENQLSEEELKQLKDNNIEIFTGSIVSNKIPLVAKIK